jgi:hypothetical protein
MIKIKFHKSNSVYVATWRMMILKSVRMEEGQEK